MRAATCFGLGVVLYEMATGQHPFPGATTAVVFDRILNHAPVAPITLNAQLPVEFENILNKTLEKDRELRCQSAAELRADLKRLQRKSSSGSVSAHMPPGFRPGKSRARREVQGLAASKPRGMAIACRRYRYPGVGWICWVALLAAPETLRLSFRQSDHQHRDHRTHRTLGRRTLFGRSKKR